MKMRVVSHFDVFIREDNPLSTLLNNFSESSQCYMGGNSPADVLSDDDDNGPNLHISNDDDDQTSPRRSSASDYNNNQTTNPRNCLSPSSQTKAINGLDDVSTTTVIKVEQENDFNCSSPASPSIQTLPTKISASSSSSAASKRLTGTLNRLLHSAINRPNGHHYNHHINGLSSSPSASSSSTTTALVDSTAKEPKITLEMSTQAIESKSKNKGIHSIFAFIFFLIAFVQHFDSSFNTMTYFQEKLQQLLVSIARKIMSLIDKIESSFLLFCRRTR